MLPIFPDNLIRVKQVGRHHKTIEDFLEILTVDIPLFFCPDTRKFFYVGSRIAKDGLRSNFLSVIKNFTFWHAVMAEWTRSEACAVDV